MSGLSTELQKLLGGDAKTGKQLAEETNKLLSSPALKKTDSPTMDFKGGTGPTSKVEVGQPQKPSLGDTLMEFLQS